jgi:ATP-dependent protease ClpP protease subunit
MSAKDAKKFGIIDHLLPVKRRKKDEVVEDE